MLKDFKNQKVNFNKKVKNFNEYIQPMALISELTVIKRKFSKPQ